MARPLRIEYEGAVYHITARGNERKNIFFTKEDYERFLNYLTEATKKFIINLHCYVLMSNHYHLIIETPKANLSRVMHYINGSYSTYINVKRKRSGHLFQGRYKSIIVDRDNYLLELSRYIHLNPVRAKMVERPEDYHYSSYSSYISRRINNVVNTGLVLGLVTKHNGNGNKQYRRFVETALETEIDDPLKDVYGGLILGRERFIKETLRIIKDDYRRRDEVSNRKALMAWNGVQEVVAAVSNHFKISHADIVNSKPSEYRNVAIYLIKERTEATNREIGEYFSGLTHSAVAKIYRKILHSMGGDRILRRGIFQIQMNLDNFKG
jgi:REP element-mobilizing transposase RayT